jgi:glycosyltransferase involved in cell wall biosynthesis
VLISVCTPTYNRVAMLARTLESTLRQPFRDFELVVSDNASTDDTAELLAGWAGRDGRVKVLRQPRNIGSVRNHNACVAAATAPWILFLHDDDALLPGALARVHAFLEAHAALDLVLPGYMAHLLNGNLFDNCLRLLNGISMSSTLYRRELLVELPFEPDNLCCDWEVLYAAAARRKRFGVYDFAFIDRGHHPEQEGAQILRDGRAHASKSAAMARLVDGMPAEAWAAIAHRIAPVWSTVELMTLARYVHHAGRSEAWRTLKRAGQAHGKWRWRSRAGAYMAAEHVLGPRVATALLELQRRIPRPGAAR